MSFTDDGLLGIRPKLRRYARFLAGEQGAADLFQSTIEICLRGREKFIDGSLERWATHLMHNVWVSQRTVSMTTKDGKNQRRPREIEYQLPEGFDVVSLAASPEEQVYCLEVCRIVETMSDDDIVLLTAVGIGETHKYLMALQDCSQSQVSKRVALARGRLHALLGID